MGPEPKGSPCQGIALVLGPAAPTIFKIAPIRQSAVGHMAHILCWQHVFSQFGSEAKENVPFGRCAGAEF